jgi:GNAT superfamily N-acetyltransferase
MRNFKDDTKSNATNEIKADKDDEQLIAHIATKTTTVSGASMKIPALVSSGRVVSPTNDPRGHHGKGRTIAIHSVVVNPNYQSKSISTILLNDYIQLLAALKNAERFAPFVQDRLIPFYGHVGFKSKGLSECNFSGGGCYDLQVPLMASAAVVTELFINLNNS